LQHHNDVGTHSPAPASCWTTATVQQVMVTAGMLAQGGEASRCRRLVQPCACWRACWRANTCCCSGNY